MKRAARTARSTVERTSPSAGTRAAGSAGKRAAQPAVTGAAKPAVKKRTAKATVTGAAKPAVKRTAKATVTGAAKPAVKRTAKATVTGAAKPAVKRTAKATVKRRLKPSARPAAKRTPAAPRGRAPSNRWLSFVEQHGVVLASARGPVPCVAEAVAGEPIIGSWWAHAKGKAIFAALSEIDDAADVRCFKLVDGKVTFVHRRVWPALARLASGGEIALPRVAAIRQEHMASGEHRNVVTPFPDWVPDDVALAATALSLDDARAQLGAWV